ncbi:DUF4097 family beta strand repeat-containing protein [Opitutus sp. GAS368]|jgi:hypothetical protein|uniref:DUF4097 family beta strand repeat-containing protein n=1 Tax=Opitutus sp. GAS368 TaxID=1882749 RepID=UPI00087D113D|nr:DUF4097 family beta strand repeat-containing protein [Opitutus sp. GAS368]SDS65989.1 Putative adhesin [Opitutus sp. GAS368]
MKSRPLLLCTALFALATLARATVTETFKQTYPLAADGTLQLDNVNGDIDIVAWDKAEVSLEAEKKGKTDEDLAKVTLEIDSSPAKLSIKTKYAKKDGWLSGSVNASVRYKLMVPAGAHLQKIDSVNSDITVTGVRGSVNLDTVNGSITATGLAADARLGSVNGSLRAEFASLDGVQKVKLDSVNGRTSVALPKGAGARIDADSVNGSVNIDQAVKLGKVRRHSLSGQIGSGGPDISLETVNGSISIKEN